MDAASRSNTNGTAVHFDESTGDFVITFLDASGAPLETVRITPTDIDGPAPAPMEPFPAAVHLALEESGRTETADRDMLFDTSVDAATGDVLVAITSPESGSADVVRVPRERFEPPPVETRRAHIAARIAGERRFGESS